MSRSNLDKIDQSKVRGSDFLQLDPGRAGHGHLSEWLAAEIRCAISDGRLPLGSKLPPSRHLAAELKVSRGVVTDAYRRLDDDGHLSARGRTGTIVVASPLGIPLTSPAGSVPPLARRKPRTQRTPGHGSGAPTELFGPSLSTRVFEDLRAVPAPVDLSPGLPDLGAFPRAAWLKAERRVLGRLPDSQFGYGAAAGTAELRLAVANWIARTRGVLTSPENVIIMAGVAQVVTLLAHVLRDDAVEAVGFEEPGSLGARQQFQSGGLATPPVPVDEEGVRVGELRAAGLKELFVTPAHQFPMGVVLGSERRRDLMRWASNGGLVIEDDYDAEHRYDRPPVPALASMLPGQVVYMGSVSKLLAPALRVGWVVPPPRYFGPLLDAKRIADLGNAALPQLVLAELMANGQFERHLRLLRARHRRRRDAMLAALAAQLPEAKVHGAAAGLHLTITFGTQLDDIALAETALGLGVKVQPLSWHRQQPGPPGLVLGYAANDTSAIDEGIRGIGEALKRQRRGAHVARRRRP